jgi:16S rRNA (guanine966-N2)-methyltransferase
MNESHAMRVISGEAKGRPLFGPAGTFTRPMQDKIKETLFSMLYSLGVQGDRIADLYAGTGAIGIEALSRGATQADFVDKNAEACDVVRKNLARTGLADRARVHKLTVPGFIARQHEPYDLVFLDPPYADPEIGATMQQLADSSLIQSGTVVAIGHWPRLDLPEEIGRLSRLRRRCHGDSCISLYQADLPPAEGDDLANPTSDLSGEF